MASTVYRLTSLVVSLTIVLTGFESAIHMKIEPQPYFELAAQLNVTCESEGPTYWNGDIRTIEIKRHGQALPIASIDMAQHLKMRLESSFNTETEGRIDNQFNKSYLTLTINQPGIQDGGLYECWMSGFGNNTEFHEWDEVNVTYDDQDIKDKVSTLMKIVNKQGRQIIKNNNEYQQQLDEMTALITHQQEIIEKHEAHIDYLARRVCKGEWTYYKGDRTCLRAFGTYYMPWSNAREVCKLAGGDLVQIHDDEKNNFVANLFDGTVGYQNIWIGVRNHAGHWEQPDYRYANGSAIDDYFPLYTNISWGELDSPCVFIMTHPVTQNAWGITDCAVFHAYVCSRYVV